MKNKSRRIFLRNTSLAATGVCLISPLAAKKKTVRNGTSIGCAPTSLNVLTGSISSAKSGNWSDPATWGGKVPSTSDTPLIATGHTVLYDVVDATVSGVNVNTGGTLKFDDTKNTILRSSANIVIEGKLLMQPASHSVFQKIEFINVQENQFVGGAAMTVVSSDVGLWVMGSGKLDLLGSPKVAWLNAAGDIKKGDSVLQTGVSPNGWQVGDEIGITPTMLKDMNFERRKITSINGSNVTIDKPLAFDKLKIDGTWTAEIMNLNRNVTIQGTQKGAAHVIIMSNVPQSIKNVELQHLGPRKDINGDNIKEFVRGRYALHFHHAADGSRGSIVESCAVHDVYSHSYVYHSSNGITFKSCLAFDVTEIPYWADPGHAMHDTMIDGCIAAKVNVVVSSLNMDQEFEPDATKSPNAASSGFKLGLGDGNACINCVAVGTYGDAEGSGGFDWEADNDGAWRFQNCLAHNNETGLFVWQATTLMHVIENFKAYSNAGHAIFHGSYANVYRYFNGKMFDSNLCAKANSIDKRRVRYENIEVNANGNFPYAVVVQGAQVSFNIPILMRSITMKGGTKGPIILDNKFREDDLPNGTPLLKHVDLVHCDMGSAVPFISSVTHAGEVIRVQPKPGQGECYKLTQGSNGTPVKEIIPRFAPDIWGTGTGLAAEYFQGNDFTNLAFTRVDPYLDFSEWYDSGLDNLKVNYKIAQNRSFSVRWKGFIEAQFTEEYELSVKCSGSFVLILDGVKYSNTAKIKVNLKAGQKHAIELSFSNSDVHMKAYASGGLSLMWNSKSLENFIKGGEPIPMSQLYPGNVISTPPPPPPPAANTGPVANAGPDVTITLPVASILLNGTGTDSDGTIKSYSWSKVSGSSAFSFSNDKVSNPTVSGLQVGTYVFRLTVTDDKDATASDDIQVTVNPANTVSKSVPTASAGANQIITLPLNVAILDGAGNDPDGNPLSYKWTKVSGSSVNIVNDALASTSATNLKAGSYTFRLTVTDSKGATASDEVEITVQSQTTRKDDSSSNSKNKLVESKATLDVTAFPNPSPTSFNVQVKSSSVESMSMNVYNRWGKLVDSFTQVGNNSTYIIGNNYKRGIYYIHLTQGGQTKIVRLLKMM